MFSKLLTLAPLVITTGGTVMALTALTTEGDRILRRLLFVLGLVAVIGSLLGAILTLPDVLQVMKDVREQVLRGEWGELLLIILAFVIVGSVNYLLKVRIATRREQRPARPRIPKVYYDYNTGRYYSEEHYENDSRVRRIKPDQVALIVFVFLLLGGGIFYVVNSRIFACDAECWKTKQEIALAEQQVRRDVAVAEAQAQQAIATAREETRRAIAIADANARQGFGIDDRVTGQTAVGPRGLAVPPVPPAAPAQPAIAARPADPIIVIPAQPTPPEVTPNTYEPTWDYYKRDSSESVVQPYSEPLPAYNYGSTKIPGPSPDYNYGTTRTTCADIEAQGGTCRSTSTYTPNPSADAPRSYSEYPILDSCVVTDVSKCYRPYDGGPAPQSYSEYLPATTYEPAITYSPYPSTQTLDTVSGMGDKRCDFKREHFVGNNADGVPVYVLVPECVNE